MDCFGDPRLGCRFRASPIQLAAGITRQQKKPLEIG
jgi:hypothetical protein